MLMCVQANSDAIDSLCGVQGTGSLSQLVTQDETRTFLLNALNGSSHRLHNENLFDAKAGQIW